VIVYTKSGKEYYFKYSEMPPINSSQPLVVFKDGYYLSSNTLDAESINDGIKITSLKQDPLQRTLTEYRNDDVFWSGFEKFLDDFTELLGR
jgi:hypothetical protein